MALRDRPVVPEVGTPAQELAVASPQAGATALTAGRLPLCPPYTEVLSCEMPPATALAVPVRKAPPLCRVQGSAQSLGSCANRKGKALVSRKHRLATEGDKEFRIFPATARMPSPAQARFGGDLAGFPTPP